MKYVQKYWTVVCEKWPKLKTNNKNNNKQYTHKKTHASIHNNKNYNYNIKNNNNSHNNNNNNNTNTSRNYKTQGKIEIYTWSFNSKATATLYKMINRSSKCENVNENVHRKCGLFHIYKYISRSYDWKCWLYSKSSVF